MKEVEGLEVEVLFDLARGDDLQKAQALVVRQIGAHYLPKAYNKIDAKSYMTRVNRKQR